MATSPAAMAAGPSRDDREAAQAAAREGIVDVHRPPGDGRTETDEKSENIVGG